MAGNEDEQYTDNPDNLHIFAINTVCNYDPDIIPYLSAEYGNAFIRTSNDSFNIDDGTQEIYISKQGK